MPLMTWRHEHVIPRHPLWLGLQWRFVDNFLIASINDPSFTVCNYSTFLFIIFNNYKKTNIVVNQSCRSEKFDTKRS